MTETPQTIDPGKFLLRVNALSLGVNPDSSAPNQYRALGLGWALLSAGITKDLDIETGTQIFVQDTYQYKGLNQTHSGIGDLSLRSKWTFWRGADYDEAAAVIPYVNLPINSTVTGNGMAEGGLIVPWSMQMGTAVKAGAMAEWDEVRNIANTRYETRLSGSGVLQFDVVGIVGVYGEATLATSTEGSSSLLRDDQCTGSDSVRFEGFSVGFRNRPGPGTECQQMDRDRPISMEIVT